MKSIVAFLYKQLNKHFVIDAEDPCKTAYVLERMDQRFKENIATGSMLCDRFRLGNGRWVRADGQDLLQTEPQPHELCGTRYPIWMKGRCSQRIYKV